MNGGRQKINSYSEYRCPKVTPFREAEAAKRYYKQNRGSKKLAGTRTSSGASPTSISPRSSSLSSASLELEKLSLDKTSEEGRGQPGFQASETPKALSSRGGHDQAAVPSVNSSSETNSTGGSLEPESFSAPSHRDVGLDDGGPNKGPSPPSFKAIPSFPSSSRMDDLRALVGFPSDLCDENDSERKMQTAYEEAQLMARGLYGTDGDSEEEEGETRGGPMGNFDRISSYLHQMKQADANKRQKALKRFETFEALKQAREEGE